MSQRSNEIQAECMPQAEVGGLEQAGLSAEHLLCESMLNRRSIAMWCGLAVAISLCGLLTGWPLMAPIFGFSLVVTVVSVVSLSIPMFRIVRRLHGSTYAFAHVVFLFALAPILFVGPILIPILVSGDFQRLGDDANQSDAR